LNKFVTYSQNVFIPVTNLCANRCDYCGFWRDGSHARLIGRHEAKDLISRGARAGCTEALFSMGERPWDVPGFERLLDGAELAGKTKFDFIDYLIELCEMAIDGGLLPHTNCGLLSSVEMKRLAPYNASMGLMLETTAEVAAHHNSPGKKPCKRLEHIAEAGRQKIPFTTGIMVGIGESKKDREDSLKALADLHKSFSHIQEVIIQPLEPQARTPLANSQRPDALMIQDTVRMAKRLLPESVAIQVPPNLVDPKPLIGAGASDLGGISPITPDWINPEKPWPTIDELHLEGYNLRERLPIYPKYVLSGWCGGKTKELVEALAGHDGLRRYKGS
jgi:FO synthase subunit 1